MGDGWVGFGLYVFAFVVAWVVSEAKTKVRMEKEAHNLKQRVQVAGCLAARMMNGLVFKDDDEMIAAYFALCTAVFENGEHGLISANGQKIVVNLREGLPAASEV